MHLLKLILLNLISSVVISHIIANSAFVRLIPLSSSNFLNISIPPFTACPLCGKIFLKGGKFMDSSNSNSTKAAKELGEISYRANIQWSQLSKIINSQIINSSSKSIFLMKSSVDDLSKNIGAMVTNYNLNTENIIKQVSSINYEMLYAAAKSINNIDFSSITKAARMASEKLTELSTETLNELSNINENEILSSINNVETLSQEPEISNIFIDNNVDINKEFTSLKSSTSNKSNMNLLEIFCFLLSLLSFMFSVYQYTNDDSSKLINKQIEIMNEQKRILDSINNVLINQDKILENKSQ